MTKEEAKAIVDGGAKYLQRGGNVGAVALMLSSAQNYGDFQKYMIAYENGAGGNLFTSNNFDTVWAEFDRDDTPITIVDYYRAGEE
jgi:hypothetical protein